MSVATDTLKPYERKTMSKAIAPLHYSCLSCGDEKTFYSGYYSEEVQAFRDFHFQNECVRGVYPPVNEFGIPS